MELLKNKRVLFIYGHGGMENLTLSLSKEFKKRWNTESCFFGGSKGGDQFLIKNGIPSENIYINEYSDSIKNFSQPDVEFIKKAEKKYDFKSWDVWQISAPRKKKRQKFSAEKVLYWMEYYLKETERCIHQFKPDYVVLYGIASFSGVILYQMLLKHKVRVLEIINSRIPNRFTINDDLENKWPLLVKEYNLLKKRDLSTEEIEKAERFIAEFLEKKFKPDGVGYKDSFKQKVSKYISYAKTLSYRKQIPDLRQFIWPFANKILDLTGTFEMPVNGEKFAYFPLHVNPEASTSFYGRWFVNQLALIENIARSLPCDYKLYVKEHPYNYSSRPLYFRREIKKFPNVRLISPHANAVDIIKSCDLVLTITGTAGWEAIMLQKPIITFGDAYYNLFEEVIRSKDLRELPSIIDQKIGTTNDKIKTLKFINAVFNSTFKGMGVMPGNCGKSLEAQNISLIVDGIEKYLKRVD